MCASFIRLPTPYRPPVQPVLTSQTLEPWRWILSPRSSAYTVGGCGRKGAPKQALKAARGSVTPRSVPATLAVYPERKWYMAWSGVRRAIGGSTPKASAVRKTTLRGWPPRPVGTAFAM